MPSACLALALLLVGHNPDTSYAEVKIAAEQVQTRLTYDVFTLLLITPLDDNADGKLTQAELAAHQPQIETFLREHVWLAINDDDETEELGRLEGFFWPPDSEFIAQADYHSANGLIHFHFTRPVAETPEQVTLTFDFFQRLGERHTVLGVFKLGEQTYEVSYSRFEPDFTYVTGAVSSTKVREPDAPPPPRPTGETPLSQRLWRFFKMGVKHIFEGYDHICFLIALIVVSKFREIVKIVTSFTIAHSITLILAALDIVELPTRFVETCIAATIVYVALENAWVLIAARNPSPSGRGWPRSGRVRALLSSASAIDVVAAAPNPEPRTLNPEPSLRHRWWLTFFFGLVHGFGFANILREMGLPTTGLVRCLLSFNLGVEAGQLAIATALLPFALLLSRWRHGRLVTVLISLLLALFGLAWFIDRALALEMMPF